MLQTKNFNRPVSDQEIWHFEIKTGGLYSLTITARGKSWRQNIRRLFHDDDLAVALDGLRFFELKGKKREFRGMGSWNGNELKSRLKAVILIAPLRPGSHEIQFWADGAPVVEQIKIEELPGDKTTVSLVPPVGAAAADMIFKNVSVEKISVTGQGNLTKVVPTAPGWAVGVAVAVLQRPGEPILKTIDIKIKAGIPPYVLGRVRLHPDITSAAAINLRAAPSDHNTTILADLKDGEELEVINQRVRGSYISGQGDIWHEVRWQGQRGFVFSAYVEIQGEERETVIELITATCRRLQFKDANTMLAIAAVESRFKPYAVGYTKTELEQIEAGQPAEAVSQAQGVFQLRSDAAQEVKVNDRFNSSQNIEGGVRYFQKIINNPNIKGRGYILEQRLLAWHAGPDTVVKGRVDYKTISPASPSGKFIRNVLANFKRQDWKRIFFVPVIFLAMVGSYWFGQLRADRVWDWFEEPALVAAPIGTTTIVDDTLYKIIGEWEAVDGRLHGIKKIMFRQLEDEIGLAWTEFAYWHNGRQFKEILSDYFSQARWEGDFLLVTREGVTDYTYTAFYRFQNGRLIRVPFVSSNGRLATDGGDVLLLTDRAVPTVQEKFNSFADPDTGIYTEELTEYEFDGWRNVFREVRTVKRQQKFSLSG